MTDPRRHDDPTPPPELLDAWRDLTPEDFERTLPPEDLWASIERSLAAEQPLATERDTTTDDTAEDAADDAADGAVVVPFARRRSVRSLRFVAAAAAAAVVAAGAVSVWTRGDDPRLVAEVAITSEGLPIEAPAPAVARLVEANGYRLELDLPDLPPIDGSYEVWIIDTGVSEMYSLGVADGSGTFDLPDGVDPAAFPVVDISVEPFDGDPTHSGQSILRGVLEL